MGYDHDRARDDAYAEGLTIQSLPYQRARVRDTNASTARVIGRANDIARRREEAQRQFVQQMEQLDEEARRLERRLAVAETLGGETDNHPGGTVLIITVNYTATPDTEYTYVLLKAGARWYCTARDWTAGHYWSRVIEWLVTGGRNVVRVNRLDTTSGETLFP